MSDPQFSDADVTYIRDEYLTLAQLCAERAETTEDVQELIAKGRLPAPTYVLPDGTEMFPPDYLLMLDGAGGVGGLREYFDNRHRAASSTLGLTGIDPQEDWESWLTGEYGVCLREVTPEAMVEKTMLIAQIDTMTAVPAVEDESWRRKLREAVDDLDEVERPFTDYDRQRWGATSRDTHITAVRAKYLSSDATTG